MSNVNILYDWWSAATPKEKAKLAKLADTSQDTIRQMACGYRTEGELRATPTMARRIEEAAEKIHRPADQPQLPVLKRWDLCPACGACNIRQK